MIRRFEEELHDNDKVLILVTGFAGSGKTTCAKVLAEQYKCALVDKDTVAGLFTDVLLFASGSHRGDRESDYYKNTIREMEYITMLRVAADILSTGGCNRVIVCAPFIDELKDFSKWEKLLRHVSLPEGVKPIVFWMQHDAEKEKQRLIDRGLSRDVYKLAHWDEYVKQCDDFGFDMRWDGIYLIEDAK